MKRKSPLFRQLTLSLIALLLSGSLMANAGAKEAEPVEKPVGPQVGTEQPAEPKTIPAEEARDLFNHGVELFQIGQVQAEKGNKKGQRKLIEEAIKEFDAALKLDSKLVEAQSNIGFAYLTLEKHNDAIKAFNKALSISDTHLNSLNGLSTAYAFAGKIDEAIQTYDRLTRLDPANPQYFFNKGSVLQKAGQLKEAQAAYEEALRIDPDYQRALFNMGTLLENQGQLSEALPYYEKAKSSEIGNAIGLEAIRRIEAIQAAMHTADKAEATDHKE